MKKIKTLFIEPYPIEGPSSRYRIEQYIPYLKDNGIEPIVRPFISSAFYKILYMKGLYIRKVIFFIQSALKRGIDLLSTLKSDIIFIHLEAFPFGPPVFEYICSKVFKKKIIYDLDDAIYMGATSSANRMVKFLKCPSKIKKIIELSDHVITCNEYLADYAKKYNSNITVIHTSIDTNKFKPVENTKKERVVVGWIGSHSTVAYLESLKDVFYELRKRTGFILKIVGAGKKGIAINGVEIINVDWSLDKEIDEFQSLDIGVYPLPDNEWTRGKTGFKTIQYMSVGVPCVVSLVGANKDIVKEGINGYFADTKDEWIEKLLRLIQNKDLRKRIGAEGRKTAVENFSLKGNAPKYLEIIERVSR